MKTKTRDNEADRAFFRGLSQAIGRERARGGAQDERVTEPDDPEDEDDQEGWDP
jgi:hypothetical protein